MSRTRRWRLALSAAAIAGIALVLSEILLRSAALIALALGRPATPPIPPGATTILVVGDSHAAGGGAAPDESLPVHLERMLAARHPEATFRVVNRGVSGANSAWVANRLEENIATYDPALIIVWVGLNDIWNLTETEAWPGGGFGVAVRRTLLHSRLYRLATVVWHTGVWRPTGWTQMRQAGLRTGSVAPEDVRRGLRFDLERMARMAFARRIPMIIVQYPLPYAIVNRTVWSTAVRLGVPLVETRLDVRRARADGHDQPALLDFAAGPHPTGLLYRYIAESTLPEVEKALRGREREAQGR